MEYTTSAVFGMTCLAGSEVNILQNLGEAVFISHSADLLEKDMNPTILQLWIK